MSEITEVKSIDDEFPRQNYTCNAKGLSSEEIEQRRVDVDEMLKMYPSLTPFNAELVWNFVHRTPKERLREIIDTKEFEKAPTKKYLSGGYSNGCVVESKN